MSNTSGWWSKSHLRVLGLWPPPSNNALLLHRSKRNALKTDHLRHNSNGVSYSWPKVFWWLSFRVKSATISVSSDLRYVTVLLLSAPAIAYIQCLVWGRCYYEHRLNLIRQRNVHEMSRSAFDLKAVIEVHPRHKPTTIQVTLLFPKECKHLL